MELAFNVVAAAGAVISAVALITLAIELRGLRKTVEKDGLRIRIACETDDNYCCFGIGNIEGGFAVYAWQKDRWVLETDKSSPGYVASPPVTAGSYEHQKLRRPSVVRRTP